MWLIEGIELVREHLILILVILWQFTMLLASRTFHPTMEALVTLHAKSAVSELTLFPSISHVVNNVTPNETK